MHNLDASLAALVPGWRAAAHSWPEVPAGDAPARVVLVTRSSAAGLRATQNAARQWASGAVPPVELLGLVIVADAPGRLPRPLRELAALVAGGVPRTWHLPWVDYVWKGLAGTGTGHVTDSILAGLVRIAVFFTKTRKGKRASPLTGAHLGRGRIMVDARRAGPESGPVASSVSVSRQLHVPAPSDRLAVLSRSGDPNRAFPVTHSEVELLISDLWFDDEVPAEREYPQTPTRRIDRTIRG